MVLVVVRNDRIIQVLGDTRTISLDAIESWMCPKCMGHLIMTSDTGDMYCEACQFNWEDYTPELLLELFGG